MNENTEPLETQTPGSNKTQKLKNKKKKQKKKKQKKKKHPIVIALKVFFTLLTICGFAVFGLGVGLLTGMINIAPDISALNLKPTTNYTSFIYDEDGNEIERLSMGENRVYVELNQIPKYFQDAVVAVEDERFWTHPGIDIKGILRAVVVNFKSKSFSEGASTITQQLIKNNILTSDKNIIRKVQEQYLAIQFEKNYTDMYGKQAAKEMILEYYLNTMHLGNGNNGVQAAANYYFNKDVSELTLRESVVLAGITQYPGRYDPIRNPENNHEKALIILNKMVEQGMITEREKQEALKEDPYTNIASVQKTIDTSSQSYFVDAVIEQVIEDLQKETGMTKVQANNIIFGGGVEIFTTLDPEIQAIVDKHMNDDALYPSKKEYLVNYTASIEKADGTIVHRGAQGMVTSPDKLPAFMEKKHSEWGVTASDKVFNQAHTLTPQVQAAFVITDHNNGQIKALSGGRGEKTGDRTFNRATKAERQPGSTFKIVASYAPALDLGILSPGSIIVDEYTVYDKGKPYEYAPKNWYSGYRGPVTAREGVYDSLNIVAVKISDMVGLPTVYDYLLNFGFTTLSEQDLGYSISLGGLTSGVTPLELNTAYAAIANNGIYTEPILYTQVKDRDGNILLDNTTPSTRTILKPSTASMLTDMMQDTVTKGTGVRVKNTFPNMPIAGKTGTTSNNKDFLFAGYTPYYTATVWMGYDQPKEFYSDGNKHLTLWATIMKDIHKSKELPAKEFVLDTSDYIEASICEDSGMLATELCKEDGSHNIVSDYILKGSLSSKPCTKHSEVKICMTSGKAVTSYCPPSSIATKVVLSNKELESCDVHIAPVEPEYPSIWPTDDTLNDNSFNEDSFFIPQG